MVESGMQRAGLACYFLVLLGCTFLASRTPLPTFDRYLYAATAASLTHSDPLEVRRIAVSQGDWGWPKVALNEDLYSNAYHMVQQEPFYAIRPLYIEAVRLLPLRLISPLAYFAIGIVLLLWLRSPWLSLPLLLLPASVAASREVTPDALSTLFVVTGFYLLVKRRHLGGVLMLVLSLTVRTDNLFILAPALVWLVWDRVMPLPYAGCIAAAACVYLAVVQHFSGNYGWAVLIAHNIHPLVAPAEYVGRLSALQYFSYLAQGAKGILVMTSVWVFLGVGAWKLNRAMRPLLLISAAFAVIHIVVFPVPEDRYFLPAYLLTSVVFASSFARKQQMAPVPAVPSLTFAPVEPVGEDVPALSRS